MHVFLNKHRQLGSPLKGTRTFSLSSCQYATAVFPSLVVRVTCQHATAVFFSLVVCVTCQHATAVFFSLVVRVTCQHVTAVFPSLVVRVTCQHAERTMHISSLEGRPRCYTKSAIAQDTSQPRLALVSRVARAWERGYRVTYR